jgi:hypothetical protein
MAMWCVQLSEASTYRTQPVDSRLFTSNDPRLQIFFACFVTSRGRRILPSFVEACVCVCVMFVTSSLCLLMERAKASNCRCGCRRVGCLPSGVPSHHARQQHGRPVRHIRRRSVMDIHRGDDVAASHVRNQAFRPLRVTKHLSVEKHQRCSRRGGGG